MGAGDQGLRRGHRTGESVITGPDVLDAGDGLVLKHFSLDDAQVIHERVQANRERLSRYLPWAERSGGIEDTLRFLLDASIARQAGQWLVYGLWQDGEFVGAAGTHDIDHTDHHFSIGYWISRSAEGRGIVTRACRRLIRLAFEELGMERVEIRVAVGNERSCAIAERLGLKLEGVLRHAQKLPSGYADIRVYSILRSEFRGG